MSNSTTNTLLSSTLTPTQLKQQASMSVYATIKSSSMLRFDGVNENLCGNGSLGNVGEAMQLFDQLIHNKTFLLTFVQVNSPNLFWGQKLKFIKKIMLN